MPRRRARFVGAFLVLAPGVAAADVHAVAAVQAARDAPEVRRAAEDVARALGSAIEVRRVPAGPWAPDPGERALLVVDVAGDDVVLLARARSGHAWPARTIARGGDSEALFEEQLAAASQSIVAAVLDAEGPAPSEESRPGPQVAPAPTTAPEPDRALQAPRRAAAVVRVDGDFVASSVGSALPVQAGGSLGAMWVASPVQLGVAYGFFPGAVVEGAGATIVVTRHALTAKARLSYRARDWELGGGVGPVVDAWIRSTRLAAASTPASPSTLFDVGGMVEGDVTYWEWAHVGLAASLVMEVVPGAPEFLGTSGPVLDPAIVRVHLDVGLAVRLP